jgi:spectinomycin phosphotransferase
MLEKPDIADRRIHARLQEAYGLGITQVTFLPLGADVNTAVYRATGTNGAAYFVKLRKGSFDAASVLVPQYLYEQGNRAVIPVLRARDGSLWTTLDAFTCLLYPYVAGRGGFEQALTEAQWRAFGAALRALHTAEIPPDLLEGIPTEPYSSAWRAQVRDYLAQAERAVFKDAVAARMATLMRQRRDDIRRVVERAEELAAALSTQTPAQGICHADIHAGNLLLAPDGRLFIVDWDTLLRAPKERDLMFIGGGVGAIWNTQRETGLFYDGYGSAEIHLPALAYYRYERIVEDIAAFCEQILTTEGGGADRAQGLRYFASLFNAGEVIDMADQTYRQMAR